MQNQEKLSMATELAQSYILLLLREYSSQEQILKVENLFKSCPVELKTINPKLNEFGKKVAIGGIASNDKIVIGLDGVEHTNLYLEIEFDKLVGDIIHEYAHKIRAINNQYGEMFEESFASIFAELCVNNAKLKAMERNEYSREKEPFHMLNSVNYQQAESQVRAILYVLKQKDLDKRMIIEFIAGNQERFIGICTQIFGSGFNDYYEQITSRNNLTSEQVLVSLLTQYIKSGHLDINSYWNGNKNVVSADNLYFQGSPTLARAVVNNGIEYFKENEKDAFNNFAYSAKIANENDNLIDNEIIDRIRNFINDKFNITGKNSAEVYDTIIDLCSSYIQYKNRTDEESLIFIEELNKAFPNIEDFKNKFVSLRVSGQDKFVFENLDLNNITYGDIFANMKSLLPQEEINGAGFGK